MYFQPKVVYRNPEEPREDSILRYVGNRVLNSNKNFLAAIVGPTGVGKSYAGLSICEKYSKQFGIEFNPDIHVISSLKELLLLITGKDMDKKIKLGSTILFDEPQVEGNARNWQSEANQALSQLVSTFRNQRLVVYFVTPYLDFIDKQSRILFHAEFKVLGYDKNTGITKIKPRFLEWNKKMQDFYRKRLQVVYASPGKTKYISSKLNFWEIPKASKECIDIYEAKKKRFTDELNKKLLSKIEMSEQQAKGRNKYEEIMRVKSLFEQYGDDYLRIMNEVPGLSPMVLEKYITFIKKSIKKAQERGDTPLLLNK